MQNLWEVLQHKIILKSYPDHISKSKEMLQKSLRLLKLEIYNENFQKLGSCWKFIKTINQKDMKREVIIKHPFICYTNTVYY